MPQNRKIISSVKMIFILHRNNVQNKLFALVDPILESSLAGLLHRGPLNRFQVFSLSLWRDLDAIDACMVPRFLQNSLKHM